MRHNGRLSHSSLPVDSVPSPTRALVPAMKNPTAGKILVIRGGAIGDFLLTMPALVALKEQFPDCHLELLGYRHIAELATASGLADQVRSIDARPLAGFFARNGRLEESLADYFASFALVISYLYDPDEIFRENIKRCSRAQFIPGPHRPDENQNRHASQEFLKPLERLAIFDPDWSLQLSFPDLSQDSWPGGNWLAVHPGSGSERKNWPEQKWAELLKVLAQKTDWNLLLVGGEAEGDRLNCLGQLWPAQRLKSGSCLPLVQLGQCLQKCHFFIGHDSGISHLAGAVGLPGLLLWGPTNPNVWRPASEKLQLLHASQGLTNLEVDQVLLELQALNNGFQFKAD